MQIASGSASELEYHLLLAHGLRLLDASIHKRLTASVHEVKQMLASLMQKVKPNN